MDCPEIKMETKESCLENLENMQLKEYIKRGIIIKYFILKFLQKINQ